jgi:hypothetical protein
MENMYGRHGIGFRHEKEKVLNNFFAKKKFEQNFLEINFFLEKTLSSISRTAAKIDFRNNKFCPTVSFVIWQDFQPINYGDANLKIPVVKEK